MKHIVVYVHGKGGSAEEAAHYKPLFPDSEVIGFDYRAQAPWEAKEEFPQFFAAQRRRCDRLTLIANSIGAFFALSSLDEALAGTDDFLHEETVKKEQAQQLREAVALLSEVDREIIRRFYDLCQTAPEIAAVLGLTPSAVRMRLVRSREAIKNELCRGGFVYE